MTLMIGCIWHGLDALQGTRAKPGNHLVYIYRGLPWRYSVIPSTPDFQTEYQIRPNRNPAGLLVFAAYFCRDLGV